MPRPVVPILIIFMTGISCGNALRVPDTPVLAILTVELLFVLVSAMKKWSKLLYLSVLLSLFSLGILEINAYRYPYLGHNSISNFIGNEKITAEGILCDNPRVSEEKTDLVVSVSRILADGRFRSVTGRVLLSIHDLYPFEYGDVIRFSTKLKKPHNFNNPGGFDYERYLLFREISGRGFIDDPSGVIILRRERGYTLRTHLEHYRNLIRKTILDATPGAEGKIIQAMILGDEMEIPKDVIEKFNRTGTTHIIAISGFNIGIVALFTLFMIRVLLKRSEYLLLRWDSIYLSTLFTILVIILYTLIAGAGISVVRASIMVVTFMSSILLNRQRDLYNTLALAAFLILVISPYSLFDISFQLSFVAVASLLFLTPRLISLLPQAITVPTSSRKGGERLSYYFRKALHGIMLFFFASLSATLATLPLILLYFNRLSLVTLIANFVVVPILGFIAVPFCLLIILAVPISVPMANFIVWISAFFVKISIYLVDWLATLPWSSIYVSTPSVIEIGAFYILLISLGFFIDDLVIRRPQSAPKALFWKCVALLLTLFFIGDGLYIYLRSIQRGELSLTAIDVGQGNATLTRFPEGKRMLIDGGGFFNDTFDVGKYVVAPFLWHERISQIDTVVLTHSHPDHLQGLLFVLENFKVREVWTNGMTSDSPLYGRFSQILYDHGITIKVLSDQTPDTEVFGVTIRILNPPAVPVIPREHTSYSHRSAGIQAEMTEEQSSGPATVKTSSRISEDINDGSLVMKLSYGRWDFLLPGDISRNSERRLVQSAADLRSHVLFVPHHGGFQSSTIPFLEKVKPSVAIISCGPDNVFGFPNADVLHRFEQIKSKVHRTDRDGAITIVTDGKDLLISTHRQETS